MLGLIQWWRYCP